MGKTIKVKCVPVIDWLIVFVVLLESRFSSGKILSIAKKNKILTAIDNTWGTPFFIKPLKLGFDMSISSGTKYFSGHSDVMLGSLSVNKKVYERVRFCNKLLGYRASPDDAYLVLRGLRTLDIRL